VTFREGSRRQHGNWTIHSGIVGHSNKMQILAVAHSLNAKGAPMGGWGIWQNRDDEKMLPERLS